MNNEILLRFLLAALWGGIVGLDREYRSKSAGFRTMILISIGACFFTMMSSFIGSPGNADRIASNIVTGIGFLGAGVIFRGETRINGITTATTIWAVAAIGMGIGSGYYFAAGCASVLIIFVLAILPYLEQKIDHLNQAKTYTIQSNYTETAIEEFENRLKQFSLRFKRVHQSKQRDVLSMTWEAQGRAKNHEKFAASIMKDSTVFSFDF
ncbi:MAG: MgtC/SapB family protein [Bacteroidota bacterium]